MAYNTQEKLSRKIKEAREQAKMSQQQLAEAIGLSDKSTIYRFETNRRNIGLDILENIAIATNKPLIWFFENEEELNSSEKLLIKCFRSANDDGKDYILSCANFVNTHCRY